MCIIAIIQMICRANNYSLGEWGHTSDISKKIFIIFSLFFYSIITSIIILDRMIKTHVCMETQPGMRYRADTQWFPFYPEENEGTTTALSYFGYHHHNINSQ